MREMAFSKGKRIEDEMSRRIIDLAVNIGCKEGEEAVTVTRLCRELNCDRRVIYNRFRDVDEINLLVARRCNEELLAKARTANDPQMSYDDNFLAFMKTAFTYIYEKNAHFQHYTALYQVTEDGVINEVLQELADLIEAGKAAGAVSVETDSAKAAQNIWLIFTGTGGMLAANDGYKYRDGLDAMLSGVRAVLAYIKH